jgi:two-component system, response regulator PdtaR
MSLSDMSDERRPTILTVEDEILISEYLGDVLRDAGYEVVATSNASDAIGILERTDDISVIITDINMPGSMDGLRLANAVRGRWPPIKIIVATGRTRPEGDQIPPGSVFLSKPYDPKAVIAAVQGLL